MSRLSIIIPSYNEAQMIPKTARVIHEIMSENQIDYELIFVDDGSKDGSWEIINACAKENTKIKGLLFSRNFGKEAAILAGFANAEGDCAVVIDCDLQQPPEAMVEMYRLWEQGYEVIEGIKAARQKESIGHKMAAGMFYKLISKATRFDMENTSDYKLLDRKAVNAILSLPEKNTFFRALSSWVGFRTTQVTFEVQEREVGETKWSTKSLFKYAFHNIVSFSSLPMQLVTFSGVLTLLIGIILGVQSLYKFITHQALEGFTTVILLILIIGSIIMISLGIIGFYIAQIYEEVKKRPQYIISKKI